MRRLLTVVAITVAGLCGLPAAASADLDFTSQQGAFGEIPPTPAPGTLIVTATSNTSYRVRTNVAGNRYVFVITGGDPGITSVGFEAVPDDIEDACTSADGTDGYGPSSLSISCPVSEVPILPEVAEPPYHLRLISAPTDNSAIALTDPTSVANSAVTLPANSVTIKADATHRVLADNGTATAVTFFGSAVADVYRPGAGADDVSGGTGSDQLIYSNFSTRCAIVTLDDVANDTMHSSNCATAPGPVLDTDNIRSDVENITGGSSADVITAPTTGSAANTLNGGGGNDVLSGGPGNDDLDPGATGATMDGGSGADDFITTPSNGGTVTYANAGSAVTVDLDGNPDDGNSDDGSPGARDNVDPDVKTILGSSGADTINAVPDLGDHTLIGNGGGDNLTGSNGDDILEGDAGNDSLDDQGFTSDDVFKPGSGDDTYTDVGDSSNANPFIGDELDYSDDTGGVSLTVNTLGSNGEPGSTEDVNNNVFEQIRGGSGADQLTSNSNANSLVGGDGADVLDGGGGGDVLTADGATGDACDVLDGGPGGAGDDDTYQGLLGGPGCRDLIDYSGNTGTTLDVTVANGFTNGNGQGTENDAIAAGQFVDILGTGGVDNINASAATTPHTLRGGAGIDTLTGGSANDILEGGIGNDIFDGGGGGGDISSYDDRSAGIVADLGPNQDGDPLLSEDDDFTSIEGLTGGDGSDQLTGDGAANTLTGGDGADTLGGGDGNDAINSRDTFADAVTCGTGSDTVTSDTLDTVNGDCELVDDGIPDPLPPPPSGGGPGGEPGAGKDSTAPVLTLKALKRQRIARRKAVVVTLSSNEPATVTTSASISISGQAKTFKLKPITRVLGAGNKSKLTIKLPTKTIAAVKKALKKRVRVKAGVTISARDAAGNVAVAKQSVTASG